MMKPMRRKDRQMDQEFALKVLDSCEYGTLATVNEDGSPYCVPISIARDGMDLYVHFGPGGQKLDNLKRDSRVCLSFVSRTEIPEGLFTTEFDSCIVHGKLEILEEEEAKIRGLRLICEKLTPGNMAQFDEAVKMSLFRTVVAKIHMEEITAKRKQYDASGQEMKYGRME